MIEIIRKPQVQGALRHLLTSMGPLLAAHGITTDAYWQGVVGIFMALLGFWLSVTAPEKKQ
ncbi:hypothetical protein KUV62_15665 [Salipiger bermudensis]|uniref:Pam3-gp28 family putative phage holin n=1 Tax=Salipiger bermudensis TaxID=344736 RepID=UPI001C9A0598|nr:hypothetical protein [Salipiger bermudensis]MBY6005363.1 hypothetical protein [Salipiger bermudensis]